MQPIKFCKKLVVVFYLGNRRHLLQGGINNQPWCMLCRHFFRSMGVLLQAEYPSVTCSEMPSNVLALAIKWRWENPSQRHCSKIPSHSGICRQDCWGLGCTCWSLTMTLLSTSGATNIMLTTCLTIAVGFYANNFGCNATSWLGDAEWWSCWWSMCALQVCSIRIP